MNRDHRDYIKDVKDNQSFAGLGMASPNDKGIIFVVSAESVPICYQAGGSMTYYYPSLIPLKQPDQKSMRFGMRFFQIKCMKSYGNDWRNLRDVRALRRGTLLMPYTFVSSLQSLSVRMSCSDLACARKELCLCSSKFPRLYLLTSVGSR
jgi:hypothetical protein